MKRALAFLSPLLFLMFAACGGGGNDSPPPNATSPAGQLTLKDMTNQIGQAKQQCGDSFAPAIMAALAAKQQGAQNPMLMALMAQGQGGGCTNTLQNVLLQAMTVDNGSWINQPQSKVWLALQTAAIMNQIGQKVQQAGGNPQQALSQLPLQQFVNQSLLPQMGGGSALSSAVNSYF